MGTALAGIGISLAAGFAVAITASYALPVSVTVALSLAVAGLGTLVTLLAWLWLYSRWSLALQAAALSSGNPLRASSVLTDGRRFQVLLRVASVQMIALAAASTAASALILLELGPAGILVAALLVRMLLSFISGAVSTAGVTPVYQAVQERLPPDAASSG